MCLALVVKSLNLAGRTGRGSPTLVSLNFVIIYLFFTCPNPETTMDPILISQNFFKFYLFLIFANPENFMWVECTVKKF